MAKDKAIRTFVLQMIEKLAREVQTQKAAKSIRYLMALLLDPFRRR